MIINPMNPTAQAIREAAAQGKAFRISKFSNPTQDYTRGVRVTTDAEKAIRKADMMVTVNYNGVWGDYNLVHPYKVEIV